MSDLTPAAPNPTTELPQTTPQIVLPSSPMEDIVADTIKEGNRQLEDFTKAFNEGNSKFAELKKYLENLQLNMTVVKAQIDNLVSIQAKAYALKK